MTDNDFLKEIDAKTVPVAVERIKEMYLEYDSGIDEILDAIVLPNLSITQSTEVYAEVYFQIENDRVIRKTAEGEKYYI